MIFYSYSNKTYISVTFGCGATINQNSSYFDSTGSPSSGQCGVNVCKASEDICQVTFFAHHEHIKMKSTYIVNDIFAKKSYGST